MTDTGRMQRERDLVTYYDNEVHERAGRELPAGRVARRGAYIEQLQVEGRRSVLEAGTGPGRDGVAFARAGLDHTGVDLAPASVARFFSVRSDEKVRAALGLHGTIECWETWESTSDLHYQFAVLRASA